jgi:hypothetical protein
MTGTVEVHAQEYTLEDRDVVITLLLQDILKELGGLRQK